jgi:hypothetical protein
MMPDWIRRLFGLPSHRELIFRTLYAEVARICDDLGGAQITPHECWAITNVLMGELPAGIPSSLFERALAHHTEVRWWKNPNDEGKERQS